jgi:hypothetical protein
MGRHSRVMRWTVGIGACLVLIGVLAHAWQPLLIGPGAFVHQLWHRWHRHHRLASRWQIVQKATGSVSNEVVAALISRTGRADLWAQRKTVVTVGGLPTVPPLGVKPGPRGLSRVSPSAALRSAARSDEFQTAKFASGGTARRSCGQTRPAPENSH